jgi:hypothetical protein
MDYTSHHFASSEAWAILRQGNGFDEVNLQGDIFSRVKNLPRKDVWGATLEKVQMYHASIQRKRSHYVLTSMLNLLEKKEKKKYVLYHHHSRYGGGTESRDHELLRGRRSQEESSTSYICYMPVSNKYTNGIKEDSSFPGWKPRG